MVKGTLGIIGCPILEDEVIYSLNNEKEAKVYVVDNDPSRSLIKKLELKGIPFTPVDEWEFDNGFVDIDPDIFNIVVIMDKLGLHSQPKVLRETLEEQLKQHQSRFNSVALYYGMCGNAGWDVSKWASEKLSFPVFVFRDREEKVCDDCIGVAVGGCSQYYTLVKRHTGRLFVTPAIADNWESFSKEMDMLKGFDILGITNLAEMFDLFGYTHMVKIDTGIGSKGDELEKGFERVSESTGLKMVTLEPGTVDMYPTERIYRDAKNALGQ
ncbi:MAG: DUF1638 domain-containing protein [Methanomassiliicoccaceae archaeon]|jgi:hypothetical protein|nr:DUF1638 domain-containing protein [Methanomassiliicoccaceae archaeon]